MTDDNELDYNGEYTVEVSDKREIPTGEKHTLELVDDQTGKVLKKQKVSFSDWQLKDGYEDRVRHWAKMRLRDINSDRPDHEGKTLKI